MKRKSKLKEEIWIYVVNFSGPWVFYPGTKKEIIIDNPLQEICKAMI